MNRTHTSRRNFLKTTGAAAAGALSSCGGAAEKPNILWITCEDLSPNLGCYGDTYAYTPNLDRLATEGVRFRRAFATAPVGTPARSCLITGIYATSLGTHNQRSEMPLPEGIRCYTEYMREAGYYCTNNSKEDYNFITPISAWDDSSEKAHWRNSPAGRPFFSIFNLYMTHQSQVRYSRDKLDEINAQLAPEERHDPADAPLPPYYPDTPAVRVNMAALYTQITLMDKRCGELLKQLDEDGLAENTIVFFFSDHGTGLPRCKRWLYNSGIKVPLIIRLPKKYQYYALAKPGASSDRLVSFVDFPPTTLSLTGLPIPDFMQGFAFLGNRENAPRHYIFAARDRVEEVLECSRTAYGGRYQYIRNYLPHRPRMQRSDYSEITPIRRELHRLDAEGNLEGDAKWLMEPVKPIEELYDTENDPHQMHNLVDMREHRGTLGRFRRALRNWIIETRDTGLLPETELARRSSDGSPYDMARQPDQYNLQHIYNTAERIGKGIDELDDLKESLTDEDAAVRYWAAVGLTVLGAEAKPALEMLQRSMSDSSPCVRIAAAEALCNLNHEREALRVLGEEVVNKDSRVQLQAAIALASLGMKARPALATLKEALEVDSLPKQYRQYSQWALQGLLEMLEG